MSGKKAAMKERNHRGIVLNLYAQTGSQFMDDVEKEISDEAVPQRKVA